MDLATLAQPFGIASADRLDFLPKEGVDLFGGSAHELTGVEDIGEVDPLECGVPGDPFGQVVDPVSLLDPGGGGERMRPDSLVEVRAVAAKLDEAAIIRFSVAMKGSSLATWRAITAGLTTRPGTTFR